MDQFAGAAHRRPHRRCRRSNLGIDAPRTGIDTAGGGFARMYGSFISWRDPHTPVPKEIVPQLAFDRLFRNNRAPVVSSVNPKDPALLTSLQRDDTSVLDLVMDRRKGAAQQRQRVRPRAARRVLRIGALGGAAAGSGDAAAEALDQSGQVPAGASGARHSGERTPEHVRLMLDILILAFWTDTTRIGTFMFGDAQSQ